MSTFGMLGTSRPTLDDIADVLEGGSGTADLSRVQSAVSGGRTAAHAKISDIGRRPMRTSVLGNSFSTPVGAGWFWELCGASEGMLMLDAVLGVSGNNTAQMLARVATVPSATDICLVLEGTNDTLTAVPASTHTANLLAICRDLLSRGVLPVLCLSPPRDSVGVLIGSYRAAEAALAGYLEIPLLDPFGGHFALSQGWTAGASTDGDHPTRDVYIAAGRAAWQQLTQSAAVSPYRRQADVYASGLAGGLFQSHSAGLGAGWSKAGTVAVSATASIVDAAPDGMRGNWQKLDAAGLTGVTQVYQTIPAGADGSVWVISAAVSTVSGSANFRSGLFVRWLNAAGAGVADTAMLYAAAGSHAPRKWVQRVVQPAGAVNARLMFEVRASDALPYTGSISVAEALLLNLSATSGLLGI